MAVNGPERRHHRRRADDLKLDLTVNRRANRVVRRAAVGLLGVVAVLLAIAVVALAIGTVNDRHALERSTRALTASRSALVAADRALVAVQQTQRRQAVGLVQSCQRLNMKQAQDNFNQRADYFYDRIFLILIRANPVRSARQRAQVREFLAPLRRAIRAKTWTPLVPDCLKVNLSYRPPEPVPFSRRQPPRSALPPAPARPHRTRRG